MGRHEGRTALIIGGTSGIGLATARLLRDEGARVIVTGSTADSVDAARAELGVGEHDAVVSDVSRPAGAEALAARVDGRLDLLFANAGVTRFVPFAETSEQAWDEVFDVNARGLYFTVQRLAPLVADGGAVVLTTSVAAARGLAGTSVYAASKAAVRSMVRSMARELLDRGVRVNAVSPGPIDTGILERALPPGPASAAREQMRGNNPMQRFGRSAEVAAAVVFLAFDATYTTGAELPVDGGVSQL